MKLRLDYACATLSEDKMSIDEIAVCFGFRDKSYFSRVFNQKYGIPPGSYRKSSLSSGISQHDNTTKISFTSHPIEIGYTLIENFGRLHRYYGTPWRVFCLDYSAAEICVALGVSDRLVGVAAAESSLADCNAVYQKEIANAPFLPGRSLEQNVPSYRLSAIVNQTL